MPANQREFHIPVMGTGFTLDSALRVARFGLSTVISLVDDRLIERVRRHHARALGVNAAAIGGTEEDARARRITAYLDLVHDEVARQMAAIRAEPLEPGTDKWRYFSLLPERSSLKARFHAWEALPAGPLREEAGRGLAAAMEPGDVGVNIMTKLDAQRPAPAGEARPEESDAKAALRGFARSRLDGKLVFSAGINPALYSYLEQFPCFSRDAAGRVRKPVVLKVSDLRSGLIQAKFLAKKGIEVAELRVESGLNCGGHVFPTEGKLLGPILQQFKEERDGCPAIFEPLLEQHAAAHGRVLHASARNRRIAVTVQGGVGTHGEMRRLIDHYGADAVGWATPFLLVPEVVVLDEQTRSRLAAAGEEDLYVSDASPLGVRFMNLRGSSAEEWSRSRIDAGTPGSPCPKGYVKTNREFGDEPICTASADYQGKKVASLGYQQPPRWDEANEEVRAIYAKQCICDQLGNGTLRALGVTAKEPPVAVCPGPNLAWFDRTYSLDELVDHIQGRGPPLTPARRPHMFANELQLYLARFDELSRTAVGPKGERAVEAFREGLLSGLEHYAALVQGPANEGENLDSLRAAIASARQRLARPYSYVVPAMVT